MAGFRNYRALGDAYLAGKTFTSNFRKIVGNVNGAQQWIDLSMTTGNPPPNYYAAEPLVAKALDGNKGLFHGGDKSPSSMHLTRVAAATPTATMLGTYWICDYLLYYPFIDLSATGEVQTLDNTVTLPRYTDGQGVRAILVAQSATIGSGTMVVEYQDQDGDIDTSNTITFDTASNPGCLLTSMSGAGLKGFFLPLLPALPDEADIGVRNIQSVQMTGVEGGLAAIVLVKPLAHFGIFEINATSEIDFVTQRLGPPQIQDGAYLGMLANPIGNANGGTLAGYLDFIWS